MTRIAIKRHALRLFWPLGSGREFVLPLFGLGPRGILPSIALGSDWKPL